MNVNFASTYPPAQAERGKFVVIDSSTITGLPSASQGRYALLTYNVGSDSTSPGASATYPMYVSLNYPNTLYMASGTYYNQAYTFTPSVPLQKLEFYNNTNNSTVYFMASSVSHNTVSSYGIPIGAYTYYNLGDISISNFTICATPSADICIQGYYRV